jgi:hypothetical protein
MHGVRLLLFHPQWAARSCKDCQTYVYNQDGTQTMRANLPVLRGPNEPTPCYKCPKIPDGKPLEAASAVELSPANRQAYNHWQECRAVGFSEVERTDHIVRRNAAAIQMIYDSWERQPQHEMVSMLGMLGSVAKVRK